MFIVLSLMLITTSMMLTTHAMEISIANNAIENHQPIPIYMATVKKRPSYALIKAAQKNDIDTIKKTLLAPFHNPNEKNEWSSTALHIAALKKRTEIIEILLSDPRVDASLKDSDDKSAYELIDVLNDEDRTLYNKLFAKARLNDIVKRHYFATLKDLSPISHEIMNITIDSIKKTINYDNNHNKKFPIAVFLSAYYVDDKFIYVDDEFIKQMIKFQTVK